LLRAVLREEVLEKEETVEKELIEERDGSILTEEDAEPLDP